MNNKPRPVLEEAFNVDAQVIQDSVYVLDACYGACGIRYSRKGSSKAVGHSRTLRSAIGVISNWMAS